MCVCACVAATTLSNVAGERWFRDMKTLHCAGDKAAADYRYDGVLIFRILTIRPIVLLLAA